MPANPFRTPEAYDTLALGGEYLPGLINVGKPSRKFKIDKKEGPGTSGDTITYRGKRTVEFVIEGTLWEEEQFDEYDEKLPGFEPDDRKVKALDVIHPTLERLKIRSVLIVEIVPPWHVGKGEWRYQFGVNEYKPPPKGANATGTPNGSTGANKTDRTAEKAPAAKSEQEKEIDRLLKLAKEP